jgi:hypothetical protein
MVWVVEQPHVGWISSPAPQRSTACFAVEAFNSQPLIKGTGPPYALVTKLAGTSVPRRVGDETHRALGDAL